MGKRACTRDHWWVWRGHFAIRKRARAGIRTAVAATARPTPVALLTGDAQVDSELAKAFKGAQVRTRCSPVDKAQVHHQQQTTGTVS
jgi:hypothetical protein